MNASPRERWGTCCPRDPHCDHSHLDWDTLHRWMDTPISDSKAKEISLIAAKPSAHDQLRADVLDLIGAWRTEDHLGGHVLADRTVHLVVFHGLPEIEEEIGP